MERKGPMHLTAQAQRLWTGLTAAVQQTVLTTVWCVRCRGTVTMHPERGTVHGGDLVLHGTCGTCGGPVARLVETAVLPAAPLPPPPPRFMPGEPVLWWKRRAGRPGGVPVPARVRAVTAKRVTIEVDEQGTRVVRHVAPQHLEGGVKTFG